MKLTNTMYLDFNINLQQYRMSSKRVLLINLSTVTWKQFNKTIANNDKVAKILIDLKQLQLAIVKNKLILSKET